MLGKFLPFSKADHLPLVYYIRGHYRRVPLYLYLAKILENTGFFQLMSTYVHIFPILTQEITGYNISVFNRTANRYRVVRFRG